jgi:hypothetical protein
MTLVPRSVSHGNRDCTTDVHRTSQDPAHLAPPGSTCQPVRDGSATVVSFPAFASEFPIWACFCYLTLTWASHSFEGFAREWCIIHGVCVSAKRYPYDFETESQYNMQRGQARDGRCCKLKACEAASRVAG